MSLIKYLLSIFFLYILVIFQTSFLVHFSFFNIIPNYALFFIVIWNLFEDSKKLFGIFLSAFGGFFLDVFSNHPIGFNILILVLISVIIKAVVKKYVRIPFTEIS